MREKRVQKRQLLMAGDGHTKSWNVKAPAWVCRVEEHKATEHCRRRRGGCKEQGAYRRTGRKVPTDNGEKKKRCSKSPELIRR